MVRLECGTGTRVGVGKRLRQLRLRDKAVGVAPQDHKI
jgi:hypothetical protein